MVQQFIFDGTEWVATIITTELLTVKGKDLDSLKKRIDEYLAGNIDKKDLLALPEIIDFRPLRAHGFEVVGMTVSYMGVELPITLAKTILEAEDKTPYINFWERCLLMESADVRARLFDFLYNNGLVVTKEGFFVAYRGAIYRSGEGDSYEAYATCLELGLDPNLVSYDDALEGEYEESLPEHNDSSVLYHYMKYLHSDKKRVYTDAHSRTTHIALGEITEISIKKVDKNCNNPCSFGLHLGTKNFAIESFGDVLLACLCDPADVVAVPYADSNKLRTTRYYPFAEFKTKETLINFNDKLDVVDIHFKEALSRVYEGRQIDFTKVEYTVDSLYKTVKDFYEAVNLEHNDVPLEVKMQVINKRCGR